MLVMNVNEEGSAVVVGHALKRCTTKIARIDSFAAKSDEIIAALHAKAYKHVIINCINVKRGVTVASNVLKHFPHQSVVLVSPKHTGGGASFPTLTVVPSANHIISVLDRSL